MTYSNKHNKHNKQHRRRTKMERFHMRIPHDLRRRLNIEAAKVGKQAAPYLRDLLNTHFKKIDKKESKGK